MLVAREDNLGDKNRNLEDCSPGYLLLLQKIVSLDMQIVMETASSGRVSVITVM